jgi:hypothetical protein
MIKLERKKTIGNVAKNFYGKTRIKWNKELLIRQQQILNGTAQEHEFIGQRWKDAKKYLFQESSNKCAFCEAKVPHVAHGDIEHYRPKSTYWWLAYAWDNYLSSCQLCNQSFKSTHFPIKNQAMLAPSITPTIPPEIIDILANILTCDPITDTEGFPFKDFLKLHKKEHPFILNPYFDNPEKILGWKADDVLGEVEVFVLDNVPNKIDYDTAINQFLGLNRLELKQLRYDEYSKFMVFKRAFGETAISASTKKSIKTVLDKMKKSDAIFAGMVRYFDKMGV